MGRKAAPELRYCQSWTDLPRSLYLSLGAIKRCRTKSQEAFLRKWYYRLFAPRSSTSFRGLKEESRAAIPDTKDSKQQDRYRVTRSLDVVNSETNKPIKASHTPIPPSPSHTQPIGTPSRSPTPLFLPSIHPNLITDLNPLPRS